ncbi:MAG: hypothetical protein D6714_00070, partial [Bacteroidetes bacterium]
RFFIDYWFRYRLTQMKIRPHLRIWIQSLLPALMMYGAVIGLKGLLPDLPFFIHFGLLVAAGAGVYAIGCRFLNPAAWQLFLEIALPATAAKNPSDT